VLDDASVAAEALATASRIASLAPGAARLNKQTFRALNPALASVKYSECASDSIANPLANAYGYAASDEHREGIAAFLAKRKPAFQTP